jgi:hypothetical protein
MNQTKIAPAVEQPEGRPRHEQPGEERDQRHGQELQKLVIGIGAAAMAARHQLRNIGVDRHQLDADADPSDETP